MSKSDYPKTWNSQKIKNICKIGGGTTPSKSNPEYWGGDTLWASPKDFVGGVMRDTEDKITDSALQETNVSKYPKDSTLVVFRSGIIRRKLPVSRTTEETAINQDLKALQPAQQGDLNGRYLYQTIDGLSERIRARCKKTGTTVRSLQTSTFENYELPVPPLAEQRRIASVLYSVDEQIRTLTDRHDSLTQLKHGLMQDLLTGETRVTPEMAVRQDVLTKNEESSVREDEKWEEHRYEEVGDIIGGGTPDTSEDDYWGGKVQWAVPSEVTDRPEVELEDTERKLTEEGLNNTSAKVLPETSVLMTSRATVGVPVINCVPMATNQGFQSFDISESDIVNPYYLYYQIEENADYIDSIASGGTFDEISKSELAKLRVNIPPLWEQERIASILYTVDEMIARTSDLIDEYERLKRGLMQDLLSGDVRTSEDLSVLDEIKLDGDSTGADGSSVTQSTLDV